MKESRKREKETKNRSHHKALAESASTLKEKNKSILSHEGKKVKSHKLSLKGKMVALRSVPKIKIKLPKNNTHSEDSEEETGAIDEYFIFENRIFPVINSDEKRTINRYFWTTESYDK